MKGKALLGQKRDKEAFKRKGMEDSRAGKWKPIREVSHERTSGYTSCATSLSSTYTESVAKGKSIVKGAWDCKLSLEDLSAVFRKKSGRK